MKNFWRGGVALPPPPPPTSILPRTELVEIEKPKIQVLQSIQFARQWICTVRQASIIQAVVWMIVANISTTTKTYYLFSKNVQPDNTHVANVHKILMIILNWLGNYWLEGEVVIISVGSYNFLNKYFWGDSNELYSLTSTR